MTTTARHRRLDLNTASLAELAGVPGLNPVLARRIIAHRPFTKMKELLHVRGVEPDTYELVTPHLKLASAKRKMAGPPAAASPPPPVAPLITTVIEYIVETPPAPAPAAPSIEIVVELAQSTAAGPIPETAPIPEPAQTIIVEPQPAVTHPVTAEPSAPVGTAAPEPELETTARADTTPEPIPAADTLQSEVVLEETTPAVEPAPAVEAVEPIEAASRPEPAVESSQPVGAITETTAPEIETRAPVVEEKSTEPITVEETTPHTAARPTEPEPSPAFESEPFIPPPAPEYTRPTARATRAAPPRQQTVVEEIIYDPEVIVLDPGPARPLNTDTRLTHTPSRALVVGPLAKVTDVLFDSYLGPRVMFSAFTATLAVILLAIAAGVISLGASTPAQSTAATPLPVGVTIKTAAPTATVPLPPTSPPAANTVVSITAPAASVPTPTTVFVPNSGLVGAGSQIFNETFNPAGYWDVGESDFSRIQIADNRLTVEMKRIGAIAWTLNGYAGGDFFYQGNVTVGSCQSNDYFGLAFRSQKGGDRYFYGISCGGQYRVLRQRGAEYDTLVDFTFTTKAVSGSNATNLLAVRAQGATLSFYVNDQFLAAVEGADPGSGLFGVFVRSTDTPNLQVGFDDLAAWQINP